MPLSILSSFCGLGDWVRLVRSAHAQDSLIVHGRLPRSVMVICDNMSYKDQRNAGSDFKMVLPGSKDCKIQYLDDDWINAWCGLNVVYYFSKP